MRTAVCGIACIDARKVCDRRYAVVIEHGVDRFFAVGGIDERSALHLSDKRVGRRPARQRSERFVEEVRIIAVLDCFGIGKPALIAVGIQHGERIFAAEIFRRGTFERNGRRIGRRKRNVHIIGFLRRIVTERAVGRRIVNGVLKIELRVAYMYGNRDRAVIYGLGDAVIGVIHLTVAVCIVRSSVYLAFGELDGKRQIGSARAHILFGKRKTEVMLLELGFLLVEIKHVLARTDIDEIRRIGKAEIRAAAVVSRNGKIEVIVRQTAVSCVVCGSIGKALDIEIRVVAERFARPYAVAVAERYRARKGGDLILDKAAVGYIARCRVGLMKIVPDIARRIRDLAFIHAVGDRRRYTDGHTEIAHRNVYGLVNVFSVRGGQSRLGCGYIYSIGILVGIGIRSYRLAVFGSGKRRARTYNVSVAARHRIRNGVVIAVLGKLVLCDYARFGYRLINSRFERAVFYGDVLFDCVPVGRESRFLADGISAERGFVAEIDLERELLALAERFRRF